MGKRFALEKASLSSGHPIGEGTTVPVLPTFLSSCGTPLPSLPGAPSDPDEPFGEPAAGHSVLRRGGDHGALYREMKAKYHTLLTNSDLKP